MAVVLGPSAPPLEPVGTGSNGRMTAHSTSVMSDGYRWTRSGWPAALLYTCARQTRDGAVKLNWAGSDAYNNGTRASRQRSVRFASPIYREALPSCAYNGKITPTENLFDPHIP